MDNKDLTEFGKREAMSHKDVNDDTKPTHAKRTKYSSDRVLVIIDYLNKGVSIKGACMAANIAQKTYYRWMNEIPEFKEMVEAAQGDIEATLISDIMASDDWRAKAWILERRYPNDYSTKQKVEVDVNQQTSPEVVKNLLINIQQKENLES